ncbi:Ger(x)C family spore germination C-terminal domain-containing protein, partial [Staphylococcus sp. SIMBA_130]
RWMDAKVKNTPVDIIVDGEHIGVVQITSPKATIKQVNDGEEAMFQFKLKMRGHVADLEEKMSSEQIEKIISQQVKDDIMQTFQASVDKDIDVYNLKHW